MICKLARSFCGAAADCACVITANTLASCYLGAARHNGFVTVFAQNSRRRMEMYIRDLHILPE